jgi:hypothetical protein
MLVPELGDKFIINWKKIKSIYPGIQVCKFPDLEFIITGLSKSKQSVYFIDNRTNKKCLCSNCSRESKCIGVSDIIITQKKVGIERDLKLKLLLKSQ